MTKEELEHDHIKKIAENYVNESWGSFADLGGVDLVMAGIGVAKIISKEKEKRIEELEKMLAEQYPDLKQSLDWANGREKELQEKNTELENQIEEMKSVLERWYKQYSDKTYTKTFYVNLITDTEILLWEDCEK